MKEADIITKSSQAVAEAAGFYWYLWSTMAISDTTDMMDRTIGIYRE